MCYDATVSRGAACKAGFAALPIFPVRFLSIAAIHHSATSLSYMFVPPIPSPSVGAGSECAPDEMSIWAARSANSSSSSTIVTGLDRPESHGWASSML